MEKTEPSLVPEWLKTSGTSSPHRHQQDEVGQPHRQRPADQSYSSYVPPRRSSSNNINNNTGLFPSDRFPYERDIYPGGNRVYPNFGRGTPPSYRSSNSEFFEHEKEFYHREWEADRLAGSNGRWPSRNDLELPVRRPLSLGNGPSSSSSTSASSSSFRENGNKQQQQQVYCGEAGGGVSTAGFSGSPVQKAAFERNFPSLGGGAQEKPSIGVYSSLANVAVLSPRHHHLWQQGHSSSNSSFESRGADSNGASSAALASPGAPKMAEALVQNPPRVKTPPQLSAEAQRLEELQLKQSRQLVPVMPKTTTLINSRDKAKSKVATPASKAIPASSSQMPRPGSSSVRPETPKSSQSKLQVLKPGVIPEAPAARAPGLLNPANARKQKQLLDRRQVPIPPLTSPSSTGVVAEVSRPRSKENGGGDDKRVNSQAQNRIEFFNAIRKKAANAGAASTTTPSMKAEAEAELKAEAGSESPGVVTGSGEKQLSASEAEAAVSTSPNGCFVPVPGACDNDEKQDHAGVNGVIQEPIKGIVGGSEEEENRFLRSLGWVEDAGGEGELTEEEINAFYREVQEHMRSKTCSPLSSVRRLQNAVLSFRCTGMDSFTTTSINSSDSESDCEARAAAAASRS